MSPCCGPSSPAREPLPELPFDVPERDPREVRQRMVAIPGGRFAMGGEDEDGVPGDGEGPVRTVHVDPFHLDPTCVTNRQFAAFVKATGYRTDAERIGWSFVFGPFLPPDARQHVLDATVPDAPWWAAVRGATWKAPEGPGTDITHRQNHPVVHVSHVDANAYARWAGKRLPTEAEWERAARGGLEQCRYPWGDELTPKGRHRCNIWQGTFPSRNTGEDGHLGTAPANSFAPNGYGLYNMSGNVWEWCADWWSTGWHTTAIPETRHNPTGPSTGDAKVIRGGSHLCHLSYCNRYRVAARTQNTPDSSTGHMGFRCAADA